MTIRIRKLQSPDRLILIFSIWLALMIIIICSSTWENVSGCKSKLWRQCSFPHRLFLVIIITNAWRVGRNVQYSCKYWHRREEKKYLSGVGWHQKAGSGQLPDWQICSAIFLKFCHQKPLGASVLNWCKILEVPLCLSLLLSCQKYYFHPDSWI